MKLTHFFIEHPRFAVVINTFIILFGLAAMVTLPVAQYPDIVPPTIQITTAYPGASADTIARTVATPLEQAINGVENMEYIGSQSTGDGNLTITVTFKIGSDVNNGLLLTNNRVQDTLSRLPDPVQRIGVKVQKVIPAYLLGIFPYSPHGSRDVAYISNYMTLRVRDELSRLPGVGGILALGERQFAMRIWIDPNRAAAYAISASDIVTALRAQNSQVSAGVLNQPPVATTSAYQINVEVLGRLTTPEQFGNIIVKSDNLGRVTRVRDIGHVELGSADYGSIGFDRWHPTQGTRNTIARNSKGNLCVTSGELAEVCSPPPQRRWKFAEPVGEQELIELPFAEILLISRHLKTFELHTYLTQVAVGDVLNPATPAPRAVDAMGRSEQNFVLEVVVTRGDERRHATARGRDSYAVSAPLACEAVERLLKGEFRTAGANAPGEVFDARVLLASLGPDYPVDLPVSGAFASHEA